MRTFRQKLDETLRLRDEARKGKQLLGTAYLNNGAGSASVYVGPDGVIVVHAAQCGLPTIFRVPGLLTGEAVYARFNKNGETEVTILTSAPGPEWVRLPMSAVSDNFAWNVATLRY